MPKIVMYNHRNKFLSYAFKNNIIENKYGSNTKCEATDRKYTSKLYIIMNL